MSSLIHTTFSQITETIHCLSCFQPQNETGSHRNIRMRRAQKPKYLFQSVPTLQVNPAWFFQGLRKQVHTCMVDRQPNLQSDQFHHLQLTKDSVPSLFWCFSTPPYGIYFHADDTQGCRQYLFLPHSPVFPHLLWFLVPFHMNLIM